MAKASEMKAGQLWVDADGRLSIITKVTGTAVEIMWLGRDGRVHKESWASFAAFKGDTPITSAADKRFPGWREKFGLTKKAAKKAKKATLAERVKQLDESARAALSDIGGRIVALEAHVETLEKWAVDHGAGHAPNSYVPDTPQGDAKPAPRITAVRRTPCEVRTDCKIHTITIARDNAPVAWLHFSVVRERHVTYWASGDMSVFDGWRGKNLLARNKPLALWSQDGSRICHNDLWLPGTDCALDARVTHAEVAPADLDAMLDLAVEVLNGEGGK